MSTAAVRLAGYVPGTPETPPDLTLAGGRWRAAFRPAWQRASTTLDLSGYALYPPLVNAHDHLELNHFPRTRFRDTYPNAHVWGADVSRHLDTPPYAALRALPLPDRAFAGGLKNLLCGALHVAQHNPPHRPLYARDYPVHGVPRRCLIAVHGVGLDADGLAALAPWLRAVVLCPSSNAYLLGAAPPYALLEAAGVPVALGSDSRLTAAGDLLDEMRFACGQGIAPAALARWQAEGRALLGVPPPFAPDTPADFLLLPAYVPLHQARRGDLALVVRGGIAQWGQPHLLRAFGVAGVPAALDGGRIALHPALAARIRRSMIAEPGLSLGARQPG